MKKRVITVSRQFGSGGHSIAKAVADKLGIPFYDNQLITEVAKQSGLSEDFIREPIDPDRSYFDGVTVIAGHVPTYTMAIAEKGKIYRTDHCILMDCGAAFGEPLGCLRLDDGQEFYIA